MNELEGLLPTVRRARDYHIYDQKGRRFLDLYQAGGEAILGHRPKDGGRVVKALVDQGLGSAYPTVWESRFLRSCRSFFAEYPADAYRLRWYRSLDRAVQAVSRAVGRLVTEDLIQEPWAAEENEPAYWRPFAAAPKAVCVLPILPGVAGLSPQLVLWRGAEELAPSDRLSGLRYAAGADAVRRLRVRTGTPGWSAWRLPGFILRGPYLDVGPAVHSYVFRRCLDSGIILNPNPNRPSILPGEWSEGERALVERVLGAQEEEHLAD